MLLACEYMLLFFLLISMECVPFVSTCTIPLVVAAYRKSKALTPNSGMTVQSASLTPIILETTERPIDSPTLFITIAASGFEFAGMRKELLDISRSSMKY